MEIIKIYGIIKIIQIKNYIIKIIEKIKKIVAQCH
jgi:hypothetical protein